MQLQDINSREAIAATHSQKLKLRREGGKKANGKQQHIPPPSFSLLQPKEDCILLEHTYSCREHLIRVLQDGREGLQGNAIRTMLLNAMINYLPNYIDRNLEVCLFSHNVWVFLKVTLLLLAQQWLGCTAVPQNKR